MKQTRITETMQLTQFEDKIAACIGYFDGLHRGHQHLINKTIATAKEKGIASALITFDPDPWTVLNNKQKVNHITPVKEKIRVAESLGIDHLITIEFTKDLSKLSPQAFIEHVLIQLNVQDLIVGEDFKFGFKGAGNVAYLKEHAKYFFDTHVIEIDEKHNEKIGTTMITQALLRGDIATANDLLGRPYQISGYVIDGQKQGRKIGFPTANMDIVDEYVIPAEGVYAGFVEVKGQIYKAMLSIGHNPTFNHTEKLSVETHILDFDAMIYGEHIKQTFVKHLRGQIKFDSIDALIEQMNQDKRDTEQALNAVTPEIY